MEKKYGVPLQKIEQLFAFQKKFRKKRKMANITKIIPSAILKLDEKKLEFTNCAITADNDGITINWIENINNQLKQIATVEFSDMSVYESKKKDLLLTIQLRADAAYEKCIFKLKDEQQLTDILNILPNPPIQNQIGLDGDNSISSTCSSHADFNDSGRDKTNLSSSNESNDNNDGAVLLRYTIHKDSQCSKKPTAAGYAKKYYFRTSTAPGMRRYQAYNVHTRPTIRKG